MRTPTDPVIATRDIDVLTDELCDALLTAKSRDETRRLLVDLCTPAEIRDHGRALACRPAARFERDAYREIHERTGVSTTTIVRVGRFLRQEPNKGYRRAIDKLGRRNAD